MRALRKGQAVLFNLTQDICGEARIVEHASAWVPVRSRRPSQSSAKESNLTCLTSRARAMSRHPRPKLDFATEQACVPYA